MEILFTSLAYTRILESKLNYLKFERKRFPLRHPLLTRDGGLNGKHKLPLGAFNTSAVCCWLEYYHLLMQIIVTMHCTLLARSLYTLSTTN